MATKYGPKAAEKVERALHEAKRGDLKSGSTGETVTSRKQAIAIGLSEARAAGGKVPARASANSGKSSSKATASRKTSARKTAARKTTRSSPRAS